MFFVLFCVLSKLPISSQHSPVNIALGKQATHCSGTTYQLTDGLTDEITIVCNSVIRIEVDFGKSYFIYYVILYCERDGGGYHTFDFFDVELYNGYIEKLCGSYHTYISTYPHTSHGYRVNCKKYQEKFEKVTFRAQFSEMTTGKLSEVAVYTFSTLENPEEQFFYLGCYSDSEVIKNFLFENIFDCSKKCFESNLILMAINKDIQECNCGTRLKGNKLNEHSQFLCDIPCSDHYPNCGGTTVYSVYLVDVKLPSIEVCLDENERVFEQYSATEKITTTLISLCLLHCDDYHYAFMAKKICSCTNQSISNIPSKRCFFACTNKPGEACNSGFVFFSTCRSPDVPYLSCKNVFRSPSFDMYGMSRYCDSSGFYNHHYARPYCIGFGREEVAGSLVTKRVKSTATPLSTVSTNKSHREGTEIPVTKKSSIQEPDTPVSERPESQGRSGTRDDTGGSGSFVRMVVTSLFITRYCDHLTAYDVYN